MKMFYLCIIKTFFCTYRSWPLIIKSPKRYNNLTFTEAMNIFQWSRKKGNAFNERVRKMPINVRCSKHESGEWSVSTQTFCKTNYTDANHFLLFGFLCTHCLSHFKEPKQ